MRLCPHCGTPTGSAARFAPYCCAGCQAVAGLLKSEGLDRYYAFGGRDGVQPFPESHSLDWLENVLPKGESKLCTLELDVQGLHCAGCVWLINELFRRQPGGAAITVNPALGKVHMIWERGKFDPRQFIGAVERFGYVFGPSRKEATRASRDLPMRIGVCAAVTMNVMMFSIAFYFGLGKADARLFTYFTDLSLYLTAVAVAVGGWPFFKSAWQGVRHGVLHLDLPIATGILLAFGTSLVRVRTGGGDITYFDTLNVFVTLMLIGRWLQQRILERNRRFLLDDAGAEGLHIRRIEGDSVRVITAPSIQTGDELLLVPGDLLPVAGELLDAQCEISTDWISGESRPAQLEKGSPLPAGAFNAGRTSIRVRTTTGWSDSPLIALLSARHAGAPSGRSALVTRISRLYVPAVLLLSGIGLLLWRSAGWPAALDVTVALLVVTCPCAIGIAIPMAEELAFARLRRAGIFVRSGDLLDRLLRIDAVVFDKTGTLTFGRMVLEDPGLLGCLLSVDLSVLSELANQSNHPVSRAIAEALAKRGVEFASGTAVTEVPGMGVELTRHGHVYRLGRQRWAGKGDADSSVFSRDGEMLASFKTREVIRADAKREIAKFQSAGIGVWLISGDSRERVEAVAQALDIPASHVFANKSPEQKAVSLVTIPAQGTLFIGEGVNDSLAFSVASACGTPAINRPVMPSKSDFFLLGEGIAGVRALFESAQVLRAAIRRILTVALTYNALAIAVCFAGLMTPLRAAVTMPASSIVVILLAISSFSRAKEKAAQTLNIEASA